MNEEIKKACDKIPEEFNREYYINYYLMVDFGILLNDDNIPIDLRIYLAKNIESVFPEMKK